MEIAIIGWGSLIWCPGCLRIKSRWYPDGPLLPIEFARISRNRRLTLVIHPGSREQRTYWALSKFGDLEAACENLRVREDTARKYVCSALLDSEQKCEAGQGTSDQILNWLKSRPGIQAAVWTGLPTNWIEKRDREFTPEDAIQYLDELERAKDDATSAYNRAREYITNTPSQIQTRLREMIRKRKGWKDAALVLLC